MSRLLRPSVALAVAAALAGCASTPPEEDPIQIKLNDLDSRIARIERVVSNQSLVQLAQSLDSVQAETRRLRGRIEELENSNESLKKQVANSSRVPAANPTAPTPPPIDPNAAVGSALPPGPSGSGGAGSAGASGTTGGAGAGATAGSASVGAATGAGAAAAVAPGPGATDAGAAGSSVEQAVYSQAFSALKAGSYSVAITGFRDFISSYPASPLAENAQYWLGEAYYVTRSYDDAGGAFRTLLQKYPQSRKAPDAMLKLGFTQYEQKKFAESRKTLQDVTQKYPDTDASRLATERLKRIPASTTKG